MNFFDKEEILESYIRSERYEAVYLSLLIDDFNISSLSKKFIISTTLPCYSDILLK